MTILLPSLLLIASAETVSFCDSIPMQIIDWNSSVNLPKFDPEMGTLTGVDLKSVLNLSQTTMVENMNNKSGNFSLNISGGLLLELPGSENLTLNVNHSSGGNLSGFDGNMDYSGPSGVNSTVNIPTEPALKSYSAIDEFLASSPGENITLPVRITIDSLLKAPGSSSSGVRMKAGSEVCITYTYNPVTAKEGGSS
ncbi:MAG: choice-of-anchor E domain-containing protein [Methanothrix sp.]|nr:choice-of-anchor E domain-containing protein [Methanothrix sp.]